MFARERVTKTSKAPRNPWHKEIAAQKTIAEIMCITQNNRFSFNILSFLGTARDEERKRCLEERSVETYCGGDLKGTKYICGRINSNTQEEAANALE